jgi:sodium/potassium-transporting ATPase subunit alpha
MPILALSIRTRYESIIHQNPFWGPKRNLRLPLAIFFAAMILLILTLVPWFQNVFAQRQVPVKFACAALGFASLILVVDESRKYIVRNYPKSWIARVAW